MILIEKHQYTTGSKHYAELDQLCFLSKNLYNSTLYHVRKHYFETKTHLSYSKINAISNELFPNDYQALPRKVSQQVQKLVDQNFKSFFQHLKVLKNGEIIRPPKYLDKEKGRQILTYTEQALSYNNRNVPAGYVKLSGVSFLIKTKVSNIKFARIVPNKRYITIEIGYSVPEKIISKCGRYASIDLGINNLATMTSNAMTPKIINGKPVKAINQFYNKQIQHLSSKQSKWTNRMFAITRKRNNKLNDYMHKASRYIVNQLVESRIDTLVIGYNQGWKQDTNIGKINNQKFVQIPFLSFVNMLKYKCALEGIDVVIQEESYTSKASFLNQDNIPTYGDGCNPVFSGKRIKRGLYMNQDGTLINADVNGSYNILRKYLIQNEAWNEIVFSDCVEACSTPSVYTVKL